MSLSAILVVLSASAVLGLDLRNKAMVNYGGFTFLLKDGCPPQRVGESFGDYDARISLYNQCISTESLQVQCETDQFNQKQTITVPEYSDQCSSICHGATRSQDCPYSGRRLSEGEEAKSDPTFVDANLGK